MRSRTYNIWATMIQRCENPNDDGYARYGAKGIRVCVKWQASYQSFLSDMGEAPEGMTLDRKDNAKGYEPGNCRWATRAEQNRNQTSNRMVGDLCMADAIAASGLSASTVYYRLKKGWPVERALSTPPGPTSSRRAA